MSAGVLKHASDALAPHITEWIGQGTPYAGPIDLHRSAAGPTMAGETGGLHGALSNGREAGVAHKRKLRKLLPSMIRPRTSTDDREQCPKV